MGRVMSVKTETVDSEHPGNVQAHKTETVDSEHPGYLFCKKEPDISYVKQEQKPIIKEEFETNEDLEEYILPELPDEFESCHEPGVSVKLEDVSVNSSTSIDTGSKSSNIDFQSYETNRKNNQHSCLTSAITNDKVETDSQQEFRLKTVLLCSYCEKTFDKRSDLSTHEFNDHIKTTFSTCQYCDKTFSDKSEFTAHTCTMGLLSHAQSTDKDFTLGKGLDVPPCSSHDVHFFYETSDNNKQHNSGTIKEVEIVCQQESKSKLVLLCSYCKLTFHTRSELVAHEFNDHIKKTLITCKDCDKTFCEEADLIAHTCAAICDVCPEKDHKFEECPYNDIELKLVSCSACNMHFSNESDLTAHQLSAKRLETQKERRRRLNKESQRRSRQRHTEEKRAALRQLRRLRYARYSQERMDALREKSRMWQKQRRERETKEEAKQRREKLRNRARQRILNETEDEATQRRENMRQRTRQKYADETKEAANQRREEMRQTAGQKREEIRRTTNQTEEETNVLMMHGDLCETLPVEE